MSVESVIGEGAASGAQIPTQFCERIHEIISELNGEGYDVISDTRIQQNKSVEYLCGSSFKSDDAKSSSLCRPVKLVNEKVKEISLVEADNKKLITNGGFTANEIEVFTEILQNAIYTELHHKMSKTRNTSSDKSSKHSMGPPHFQNNDYCRYSDLSLREIKATVRNQLSLICHYEESLYPCPIAPADHNLIHCVREKLVAFNESKTYEVDIKNQEFNVDKESLNQRIPSYEEDGMPSDMRIKNMSSLRVNTGNDVSSNLQENEKNDGREKVITMCKFRDVPMDPDFKKYLDHTDCEDVTPYTIGSQGKSDLIAKWGKRLDVVDQVLSEQHLTTKEKIMSNQGLNTSKQFTELEKEIKLSCITYDEDEDDYLLVNVCGVDEECVSHDAMCKKDVNEENYDENRKVACDVRNHTCHEIFSGVCVFAADDFDNLRRFDDIGNRGVASLCRTLTKWTHCVTKTLCEIRKHPHLVIHIPSFSYPRSLRIRVMEDFKTLQNIQVIDRFDVDVRLQTRFKSFLGIFQFGRLAWIGNKNTQVLYVCPNLEVGRDHSTLLRELVARVRPDVNLDNLWIIQSNCFRKTDDLADNRNSSGIENLFTNPQTYRRVRNLTAGRQAFIIPGVMEKKDIFVACELKLPILSVSLKCQNCFKLKSEFIRLLKEFNVNHPPSLGVHDFAELSESFAKMIIEFPVYHTWLVKIDMGFNGYHTAIVIIKTKLLNSIIRDKSSCALNVEEKWTAIFMKMLPTKLKFNRKVYDNYRQFIRDLDRYGGIVQACPEYKYKSISLGITIEHDTACPTLLTTAEAVQFKNDIRTDIGYVIPQTTVCQDKLEELTRKIGMALRREGLVGFFGIDLVAFTNKSNVRKSGVSYQSCIKHRYKTSYTKYEL